MRAAKAILLLLLYGCERNVSFPTATPGPSHDPLSATEVAGCYQVVPAEPTDAYVAERLPHHIELRREQIRVPPSMRDRYPQPVRSMGIEGTAAISAVWFPQPPAAWRLEWWTTAEGGLVATLRRDRVTGDLVGHVQQFRARSSEGRGGLTAVRLKRRPCPNDRQPD